MAQKLIKINTDHYVVVDDLEITQACYVYKNHENVHGRGIFYLPADTDFVAFNKEAKDISVITHSTQKLYKNDFWAIQELKLSEVKELIGEVDVEKKAYEYAINDFDDYAFCGYVEGYNQALEDNKDKKYTEEDVISIVKKSRETGLTAEYLLLSIQPKTEWEVQIVDGKLKLKL